MLKITLILIFITMISSLSLQVDQTVSCLYFHQNHQKTFFRFEITSERNSKNTSVNLMTLDGKLIQSFQDREGQGTINNTQPFKMCFQALDRYTKHVTFDVWEDNEHDVRGLAKKGEYYELQTAVTLAVSRLMEIARNQKFHTQKHDIHFEMIAENEIQIRKYEIVKMIVMVIFIIGQIVLFKLLLGGKKEVQSI